MPTWRILEHGMCKRDHPQFDPEYVDIGHPDIVGKRTAQPVGIVGHGDLGDFVPFYFCGHTPMILSEEPSLGLAEIIERMRSLSKRKEALADVERVRITYAHLAAYGQTLAIA